MRRTFARALLVTAAIAVPGSAIARPWTIEDSVEARYFVTPDIGYVTGVRATPVLPSPDGSRFLILSRRGDVASDANIFEFRIYDTKAAAAAVASANPAAPYLTFERRSFSNAPIKEVRWSSDGQYLRFSELNDRPPLATDTPTLYQFDLSSKKLVRLGRGSENAFDSDGFPISSLQPYVVAWRYDVGLGVDRPKDYQRTIPTARYPSQVWTPSFYHEQADSIEACELAKLCGPIAVPFQLYVKDARGERVIANLGPYKSGFERPLVEATILPGGKAAIGVLPVKPGNSGWRRYELWGRSFFNVGRSRYPEPGYGKDETTPAEQFVRIDLASGKITPLFDAPTGRSTRMGNLYRANRALFEMRPRPILSPDGKKVLLVDTALPGDAGGKTAYVASYDVATGRVQAVVPVFRDGQLLKKIDWSPDSQRIRTEWTPAVELPANHNDDQFYAFRDRQKNETIVRDFVAGANGWRETAVHATAGIGAAAGTIGWKPARPSHLQGSRIDLTPAEPVVFSNGLEITLKEAADQPQHVEACVSGKCANIVPVDPRLAGIDISPAQTIEWTTDGDQKHRGLLTLPYGYRGGKIPVVLQLYAYMPHIFRPDGYSFSGYARQLLAASGMAVLELSTVDHQEDKDGELAGLAKNANAAIDKLVAMGIADTERLGAVGFSRGGFEARHLLIHPGKYRFKAASVNDSFILSLGAAQYYSAHGATEENQYAGVDSLSSRGDQYGLLHGSPWENPRSWMENADDLSTVRATGALREVLHMPTKTVVGSIFHVNQVGSFLMARRPIEFVQFPDGDHVLQRPRERQESLSGTVDWMNFWLTGVEDPNPAKAEQYGRWRKLKADWDRQQAWEAAGHAPGSTPNEGFQIPSG